MAYLPIGLATEGTELSIDVRGKPLRVEVVPRPFVAAHTSPIGTGI